MALNKHLDTLDINIDADKNISTLGNKVNTDIAKELAENIVLDIERRYSVKNNINVMSNPATIEAQAATRNRRSFSQYAEDVFITAAIKTELLASKNTVIETFYRNSPGDRGYLMPRTPDTETAVNTAT